MGQDESKELSRRDFLAWAAAAAAALVVLPGCDPAYQAEAQPVRSRPSSPGLAYASVRTGGPGTADFITVPDLEPVVTNGYVPSNGSYQVVNASYTPVTNASYTPMALSAVQTVQPVQTVPANYVVPAQPTYMVQRPVAPAPVRQPRILPTARGKVQAIGRNTWGATPAIPAKMRPMGGVARITVHHEGSAKPNNDNSPAQVAATLRLIQSQHRKRMGAGDIGYHFIIDRSGTIWQGRDWQFQGAHTSGANANNIGVMLLGNFEIQQPTQAQLMSLHSLVGSLVRKYGLRAGTDIFGHSDFCNTQCPGKHLKPQVQIMRAGLR